MKIQRISKCKLKLLKPNPDNPRVIRDSNFKKLLQSLQDFPEMLELREVVVDEDYVILGGNQRYTALKELGVEDVPVVQVFGLTDERKKEFVIKDNVNYGVWDWDVLGNLYEPEDLKSYGLNVWQPQEAEDEMEYDFEVEKPAKEKEPGDKPVVYIVEFDINDYPAAFQLSKEITDLGGSIGDILVKVLKDNYEG